MTVASIGKTSISTLWYSKSSTISSTVDEAAGSRYVKIGESIKSSPRRWWSITTTLSALSITSSLIARVGLWLSTQIKSVSSFIKSIAFIGEIIDPLYISSFINLRAIFPVFSSKELSSKIT